MAKGGQIVLCGGQIAGLEIGPELIKRRRDRRGGRVAAGLGLLQAGSEALRRGCDAAGNIGHRVRGNAGEYVGRETDTVHGISPELESKEIRTGFSAELLCMRRAINSRFINSWYFNEYKMVIES